MGSRPSTFLRFDKKSGIGLSRYFSPIEKLKYIKYFARKKKPVLSGMLNKALFMFLCGYVTQSAIYFSFFFSSYFILNCITDKCICGFLRFLWTLVDVGYSLGSKQRGWFVPMQNKLWSRCKQEVPFVSHGYQSKKAPR